MTDIVDQPPPVASNHRPAWELVIEYVEKMSWRDPDQTRGGIEVLGQTIAVRDLLLADMICYSLTCEIVIVLAASATAKRYKLVTGAIT